MNYNLYPGSSIYEYASMIVENVNWRKVEDQKPFEWANLQESNPEWFMRWVNYQAPTDPNGKYLGAQSILYVAGRPKAEEWYQIGTFYLMTKDQTDLTCPNGSCVDLDNDDQIPW